MKKSVTLMTTLAVATIASGSAFAEENKLSYELGHPSSTKIAEIEAAIKESGETTVEVEEQKQDGTAGSDVGIVPADPGNTVPPTTVAPPTTTVPTPTEPETPVPPTTTVPTPADPGNTVPPTTVAPPTTTVPTPAEPETTVPPAKPEVKPDTSTEPKVEPTPIVKDNFNPFLSGGGQKIVGTDAGSIIIENVDGSTQKVTPESLGATLESDGTITVKDSEGKLKRLPNTGEASSYLSVLGLGLLGLLGLAKKKNYI